MNAPQTSPPKGDAPTGDATMRVLRALAALGPARSQNLDVVSIEPIRDSLGERWPAKREQVMSQAEHLLRHQFRPQDLVLRLDEVSLLVVQPGRQRLAAQTFAIRAAADLTRHFLGDTSFEDIQVRRVEAIEAEGVVCAGLAKPQIAAALMGKDRSLWTPVAACRMPIMTPLGRTLSVDMALKPMLALGAGRAGFGHAAETTVKDAGTGEVLSEEDRGQLQSSDLAAMDLTVFSTTLAKRAALGGAPAPLVAPVSYHTLSHTSARYTLLQAAHRLSQAERQSFLWEVVDLEPGAPAGRIAEVVAIARPHCRGVICRADLSLATAKKVKDAGATLSIDPGGATLTEAWLARHEAVLAGVLRLVPTLLAHRLTPELLPLANLLGVTHCTVAAP